MLAPVKSTTIFRGAVLAALLAAGTAATAVAQDDENPWPIQIDDPRATIVIFQPQPESFENNIVTSRAALSVTEAGKTACLHRCEGGERPFAKSGQRSPAGGRVPGYRRRGIGFAKFGEPFLCGVSPRYRAEPPPSSLPRRA